ncbi:hypothetical protein Trydic_g13915 [Trypoxylus dichotomus]
METYRNTIKNLEEKLEKSIKETKQAQNTLEQYTRKNSIRVFGIPETKNEDTALVISKFCKDNLKLDIPVTAIEKLSRNPLE